MKKALLTLAVVLQLAFYCQAQTKQSVGMNFEHLNSWQEVLAKAKQTNKMIFLDCYTTWCGPCRAMSNNIFPQKEVGEFYNAHFINAKVQLDTTAKDDEYIKKWYKDGHEIAKKYEVRAYPTYLIFNSDGDLVHRFVGSMDGGSFVAAGKKLLSPDNQYYTQVKKYENGDKSPQTLLRLANLAMGAYDAKMASKYAAEYLATQPDIYTKENLELLYSMARTSQDKGFQIALTEPERADKILESPQKSFNLAKGIILNEELGRLFGSLKKDTEPDFEQYDNTLKEKYPAYAGYISAFSKMYYYQSKKNLALYAKYVDEIVGLDGFSANDLNNHAWGLFERSADKALLEKARQWSKLSLTKDDNATYIDTHANILYKLGNVAEAIAEEKRAKEVAIKTNGDVKWCEDIIAKMEKGEPTWPQQ